MYLPPFHVLAERLGTDLQRLEAGEPVTVPAALFRHLIQLAAAASEFDEKPYLAANPDIAEALRAGAVRSARLHFVTQGYFEQRPGGHAKVDEAWYLKTYPDVAEGVKRGMVGSATEHFVGAGAAEMRSPSAKHQKDVQAWATMIGKG
jgi:hypothetical protein